VFSYDCQVLQTLSVWCRVCARPGLVRAVRMFWSQLVEWVFGAQVTGQVARHASSSWRACCVVRVVRPPVFVASINGKQARKTLPPSAAQDRESLCSVLCVCSVSPSPPATIRLFVPLISSNKGRHLMGFRSPSPASLQSYLASFLPASCLNSSIWQGN
jgi:hypothetical protein